MVSMNRKLLNYAPLQGSTFKGLILKVRNNRRRLLPISAGLILVLLPILIYSLYQSDIAEASWSAAHQGWTKRKQLTITNNSAENLASGTTVAISVNAKDLTTQGKLQDDCDDIRILYQNGGSVTDLDRYISVPGNATCGASGAAKVHFPLQAALNAGSSDTDYYLYYSNPQASAPTGTVDTFDVGSTNALLVCPFDGTTECINGDGAEDPTAESGAIRYGGAKSAMEFAGLDATGTYQSVTNTDSGLDNLPNNDFTLEFWMYWHDDSQNVVDTPISKRGTPNGWRVELGETNGHLNFLTDCTTQDGNYGISSAVNYDEWTHIAVSWDASSGTPQIFINGSEPAYSTTNACTGGYQE